jgi:L-asparagine transporter-like permease
MTKNNQQQSAPKERGCWLTGWIILIALHGVIASVLVAYQGRQPYSDSPLWLTILGLLAIADIVAMIAVWYWKRWGLVLYAISTAIGIAIGLVLTRTQLWVFHDILPLVILGYLIKDKWSYFGIETK